MTISFANEAWTQYQEWLETNPEMLDRINELIKQCSRDPFKGIGKPEPLKGDLKGFWSRRINHEHRLVYRYSKGSLEIVSCKYHY
ncbi:MAG: Txe/YoeB family addiction module toxin [Cyclobacteriaceae bacterium]|nr:Txe/YoeB family addiction module toxin [Cyclobacteriaceae bacterium]